VPTTVKAIFFDVNGTLRVREPHEQTQRAAFARLQELIGSDDIDWDELTRRQIVASILATGSPAMWWAVSVRDSRWGSSSSRPADRAMMSKIKPSRLVR
jgi:FMN phosphatase YigB (HAD superfamily)